MSASLVASLLADWQTLASWGIGLVALAYVSKRWWPALAGLLGVGQARATATNGISPGSDGACGQPAAPSGACQSGCGSCGQSSAVPTKDHRVHLTRRSAP
jgi:hypothetical protein